MIFPYLQIDFVAHDDIPYSSAGSDDVYKHIKEAGKLICILTLWSLGGSDRDSTTSLLSEQNLYTEKVDIHFQVTLWIRG